MPAHQQLLEQSPKGRRPLMGVKNDTPIRLDVWAPIRYVSGTLGLRSLSEALATTARRLASRSARLSSIYYCLFNRAFSREHQAILAGRVRYEEHLKAPAVSSPLLRRNVHRLEKGLLMRPRRSVFALDYIEETVQAYQSALRVDRPLGCGWDEVHWAHDVLASYFAAAGSHPTLDRLRDVFKALPMPPIAVDRQHVPYPRDLTEPPPVRYDDLLELSLRRRSVRWFVQKKVPRELIDRAVLVAGLSPSACNRQPFVFRVIDDGELLAKVAAIPMGTEGYRHNIPLLVVLVGQLRNFFSERDRHLIYIDGSLAAMSFAYAVESLGLSSCMINWPDIEEKEQRIAQVLGLDPDERPIMLIAVGYPDAEGLVAASTKKRIEQLRRYNFEGAQR